MMSLVGAVILKCEQMAAMKWALKTCTRNSSQTLKVFPALSTSVRFTTSRKLQSDPGITGLPQCAKRITFRHSHRKWKSPIIHKGREYTEVTH